MKVETASQLLIKFEWLCNIVCGAWTPRYVQGMKTESWLEAVVKYIAIKPLDQLSQQAYYSRTPNPTQYSLSMKDPEDGEEVTRSIDVFFVRQSIIFPGPVAVKLGDYSHHSSLSIENYLRLECPEAFAVVVERTYKSSKLQTLAKTYDVFYG